MATSTAPTPVSVPARLLQGRPPYPSPLGNVRFVLETSEIFLTDNGIHPGTIVGQAIIIEVIGGRSYQGTFKHRDKKFWLDDAKKI